VVTPDEIETIEAALGDCGVSVRQFCETAGISRATWQRWKARKTTPNMRSWRRVLGELRRVTSRRWRKRAVMLHRRLTASGSSRP
jgi:hypothetical protein